MVGRNAQCPGPLRTPSADLRRAVNVGCGPSPRSLRELGSMTLTARMTLIAAVALCITGLAQEAPPRVPEFAEGRDNIALGKLYEFNAVPSYRYTRNETDQQDLTDGTLARKGLPRIWVEPDVCGWSGVSRVNIQVDLGKVQPIEEAAISLSGGKTAGVAFPREVTLLVSHDAKRWQRVGRFRKQPAEAWDSCRFGVPEETGAPFAHQLRFRKLICAGRYVGFSIVPDGHFVSSDELYVFRGKFSAHGAKRYRKHKAEFVVHDFVPGGFSAYFSKRTIYVSNNVQTYQTLMGWDDRGETKEPVILRLDLPSGLSLRRAMLHERLGGAFVDAPSGTTVQVKGKAYTRHEVTMRRTWSPTWAYLFFATSWDEGHRDTVRISASSIGKEQRWEDYAIEAVTIEPVKPLERLQVSICWMQDLFWTKWPDGLKAVRSMGIPSISFFPRYSVRDGKLSDLSREGYDEARAAGFQIIHNSSPLHSLVPKLEEHPELLCQSDRKGVRWICPCYRGELYQEEVEAIAQRAALLRPNWLIYDCEMYSSFTVDVPKSCKRCRAQFKKSGAKDWQRFVCEQMTQFYRDIHGRIEELAPGTAFQSGAYDVFPGRVYQNVWDPTLLYPRYHQFFMPAIYVTDPREIGTRTREIRGRMAKSDIIPWLHPGNLGEMPAEYVRCGLLEACLNGSRGAAYYTHAGFDAADYKALAEAIAVLRQIEDIIVDGKPLKGMSCNTKSTNIGGMRLRGKAALFVSDYEQPDGGTAIVRLPGSKRLDIAELLPKGTRAVQRKGDRIRVVFGPERGRVFLLNRGSADTPEQP